MATRVLNAATKIAAITPVKNDGVKRVVTRTFVTSPKGEILAEPVKVRFGVVKILAAAIPGIFVGAALAKNGAAWLEENEIFIPDDDDDD